MTVVVTVDRLVGHDVPAGTGPSSTVSVMVAVPGEVHMKGIASEGPAASSEAGPDVPVGPSTPIGPVVGDTGVCVQVYPRLFGLPPIAVALSVIVSPTKTSLPLLPLERPVQVPQ